VAAKKKAGENVSGNLDSLSTFVQKKTEQIRKQYACQGAESSVELADGHVKLKAKAKGKAPLWRGSLQHDAARREYSFPQPGSATRPSTIR
jgi:hypothetical protein